ncbi:class I SAM-dependent methyltransferase [Candidatus Dojkabacteria bacterium]|nr:class I SAM-dependent methyltransferase [Candidatus Dojkabacteria bacterium]
MSKYSVRKIDLDNSNDSLSIIYNWVAESTRIIDMGCDSGSLCKLLKENKKCEVYGLEINKSVAQKAQKICKKVWTNSLDEDITFDLIKEKFDYVIFADVLEHTVNPSRILMNTKKILNPNGEILISIPNIAHQSIRLELLNGSFDPELTGILDNTHLHYFTLKSFSDILKESGYIIVEKKYVERDVPREIIKSMLENVGLKISSRFVNKLSDIQSQAYQYIFRVKPSDKIVKREEINIKFKPMLVADKSFLLIKKQNAELMREKEKYQRELMEFDILQNSSFYKSIWTLFKKFRAAKHKVFK